MTPGQFRELPYEQQIEMLAEYVASNEMDAYDYYKNKPKEK